MGTYGGKTHGFKGHKGSGGKSFGSEGTSKLMVTPNPKPIGAKGPNHVKASEGKSGH